MQPLSAPGHAAQTRPATASGWIGSALEYYDFFIYATAASLVFPQVFFPSGNPQVAIVASLATYSQVGVWAPVLLVALRLIQGFAVAGELSGASSMILEHAPLGHRGYYASFTLQGVQAGQVLAAAVFLPLARYLPDAAFNSWGWRVPFLLSAIVVVAGYVIRRRVAETPVFRAERERGTVAKRPIVEAFRYCWQDMLRVASLALMNVIATVATIFGAAYAVQPAYGIGFNRDVYLWIPVLGNIVAVVLIPFVGRLSDTIGRRPPIIVGALGSGLLAYAYLYAISIRNVPMAMAMSLLMWGVVYQGYNAVFPSYFPELFPTRNRVSAMAVAQNVGTFVTAMLPALFAWVAPPGTSHIPLIVGSIAFATTSIAALAAWSARETYRLDLADLGNVGAVPLDAAVYAERRAQNRLRAGE